MPKFTKTPTPGDIVKYNLSRSEKEDQKLTWKNGADSFPAIVTQVFSPTCVNLKVFAYDDTITRSSVSPKGEEFSEDNFSWEFINNN